MMSMTKTPLLDAVHFPRDMRNFSDAQLEQLACELRLETIDAVAHTGGHLGAGLGVVELTVAIHNVFNTPEDLLIWDVGHQSYPHKILTGRRDKIRTIRKANGLSGFCKRSESEYDPFGAGHSSTSISAALGMAVARDLDGKKHEVIAVIGDGAMSAGMAYEAMNNAGSLGTRLIVILNDNEMSISRPVGAMSTYLARLISSHPYHTLRDIGKAVVKKFPEPFLQMARKAEHLARDLTVGGTLFEQLGFYYIGPVDGHNLSHLLPILRNIKNEKDTKPILLHVITKKGHGYAPAEASEDKYHGVSSFDVGTGTQNKAIAYAPSYTKVFAQSLIAEAKKDDKIVAITAAMDSGTGLDLFEKEFPQKSHKPQRMFDVGIAEQHAVTFAAGLATQGYKPFCAIYSTFLQRAYDQVVHDVAIQNLPVRFAIDRAGLVGADGATHAGSFDISYLASLPNFIIMAASDEAELVHMVATQVAINNAPSALRYPRGDGVGVKLPEVGVPLPIGKGRLVRENAGARVALLSLGTRLAECVKAADMLAEKDILVTVADARFAKPLDEELVRKLFAEHELLITVEEGAIGGFGSHILHFASSNGLLDGGCKLRTLCLPDSFIEQNNLQAMYDEAGLNAQQIVEKVLAVITK